MIDRRFVVCLFLSAGLAVGCASAASPTETIRPSAVPTAVATPTISPTHGPSPSPAATISPTATPGLTPAATITTIGPGSQALSAGTYRLELAGAPTILDADFPTLRITVPDSWGSDDRWVLRRGMLADLTVAVQFWNVDQLYGHACQWIGTLFRPGPSVDDLVKALVDRPLRNATSPVDVTLDGYAGKYLEWSVPTDIDFSECDAEGSTHYFESWKGPFNNSDRYHQGPGQVDRLWILDVDGARLVIDAFDMPDATTAEREELLDVVESIKFER